MAPAMRVVVALGYLKAREANADERVEPGSSGNVYVCSSEKRFFMSVFFSENELY
jgi:hypothetical protein